MKAVKETLKGVLISGLWMVCVYGGSWGALWLNDAGREGLAIVVLLAGWALFPAVMRWWFPEEWRRERWRR